MNTYIKHKKLSNGEYISFYNDGAVKYRGLIVDDKKHGVETHYKPSGDFDFNVKYDNG
jgi:antitoxin component YwqK of YwqJK toxin-antitoxin module